MTVFFPLYFCFSPQILTKSILNLKKEHITVFLKEIQPLEGLCASSFLGPEGTRRSDLLPAGRTGDVQPRASCPGSDGSHSATPFDRTEQRALEERLPAASLRRDTRLASPGDVLFFQKEEREKLSLKNLHRK